MTFADDMGINIYNSSPYYAQANGQAEASNKILIKVIKKKIEQNPRKWYLHLSEALWAYRMAQHGSIKASPYELVYGHAAVLPWEIQSETRRVTLQNKLTAGEYKYIMMDSLEDLHCHRLRALEYIEKNKIRVAKYYNTKVRSKSFTESELVWKVILPIDTKDSRFGKWSPNWEGPYRVVECAPGNAYILEDLEGQRLARAINGKHLKKYCPSIPVGG